MPHEKSTQRSFRLPYVYPGRPASCFSPDDRFPRRDLAEGEPEDFRAEAFGHQMGGLVFNEVEFNPARFLRDEQHISGEGRSNSRPGLALSGVSAAEGLSYNQTAVGNGTCLVASKL